MTDNKNNDLKFCKLILLTCDLNFNTYLRVFFQPLDYEARLFKNVSLDVSVENEIPYHSCKVVTRRTTGLWEVVASSGATGNGVTISGATQTGTTGRTIRTVTVTVEDVNDPPIFDMPNQQVTLGENVEEGQYLATFTARDPDITAANTLV